MIRKRVRRQKNAILAVIRTKFVCRTQVRQGVHAAFDKHLAHQTAKDFKTLIHTQE
ncbi:hypothetical protein [Escherichia fergusonii]|uniref:hypothetical protein n=1 Tax=Escherichia fergusonii TaxID=564 RepID=UPI00030AB0AB|nr:hypothetical protein [Escherichia fergusonii]URA03633.1 hypothetical protein MYF53_21230 [Escherichia fergusonii]